MPFILVIALLLAPAPKTLLLTNLSPLAKRTHTACLQALSLSDKIKEAQGALLCGENIRDENLKNLLTRTSLIHLFIVSGSHLLLLDALLAFLNFPLFLRLLFFALYTLTCSLQPPIFRAFAALLLGAGIKIRTCHWPHDLTVLMTGLFCLLLFPEWVESRSLVMSWLAALALCLTSFFKTKSFLWKVFLPSIFVYLLMIPALWGFGNLHPLGILFNVLLAPYVAFILMPLAFFSLLWSGVDPFFALTLHFFGELSRHFSEPVQIEKTSLLQMPVLWAFIFSLHGLLHFLRLHLLRKRS